MPGDVRSRVDRETPNPLPMVWITNHCLYTVVVTTWTANYLYCRTQIQSYGEWRQHYQQEACFRSRGNRPLPARVKSDTSTWCWSPELLFYQASNPEILHLYRKIRHKSLTITSPVSPEINRHFICDVPLNYFYYRHIHVYVCGSRNIDKILKKKMFII